MLNDASLLNTRPAVLGTVERFQQTINIIELK